MELGVAAGAGQEFRVGPLLQQAAPIEYQDQVRVTHGAEPIGDDEARPPGEQDLERMLNDALGLGINRAGRFIENQQPRDHFVRAQPSRGRFHFRFGRFGAAESQIVHDRPCEQKVLLRHKAQLAVQRFDGARPEFEAVDEDPALVGPVEVIQAESLDMREHLEPQIIHGTLADADR